MARGPRKKPEPTAEELRQFTQAVNSLAQHVRQLCLIMDEIREDLIHAVRETGLDPAMSAGEYQDILCRIEEAIGDMEEQDVPTDTRRTMPVEPRPVRPTSHGTLFE